MEIITSSSPIHDNDEQVCLFKAPLLLLRLVPRVYNQAVIKEPEESNASLLSFIFNRENEGGTFIRNFGTHLQYYRASQPRSRQ